MTKADVLGRGQPQPVIEAPGAWGSFVISSVTRSGLDGLLEGLWQQIQVQRSEPALPDPVPGSRRGTAGERPAGEEEVWWRAVDEEF